MPAGKTVTILIGPTASGKSARALEMARETDAVIINADSMQVYDALPVLTAQPSRDEKEEIPHRLYGVLGAADKCSAQIWRGMAVREIEAAWAAGKQPLVVGGTGLYIKALMEGFSPVPDVPEDVRARVTARQRELGNPAFHEEFAAKDPVMAARLNPNDSQRLIRACEVFEHTGKSLADWQELPPAGPPADDWAFQVIQMLPDRKVLHERISGRFDKMMEAGALEEVRALDDRIQVGEVAADAPVTVAHGFRPLRRYLHGDGTLEEAVERTKIETRQYAKRQSTWIRGQL